MLTKDIVRMGLILAIQAEIEGMKAENKRRESYRVTPLYGEADFNDKAYELRHVSRMPDDKL